MRNFFIYSKANILEYINQNLNSIQDKLSFSFRAGKRECRSISLPINRPIMIKRRQSIANDSRGKKLREYLAVTLALDRDIFFFVKRFTARYGGRTRIRVGEPGGHNVRVQPPRVDPVVTTSRWLSHAQTCGAATSVRANETCNAPQVLLRRGGGKTERVRAAPSWSSKIA